MYHIILCEKKKNELCGDTHSQMLGMEVHGGEDCVFSAKMSPMQEIVGMEPTQ